MRQGSDRPDISERLNGAHAPSDYDALADLFLGSAPSAALEPLSPKAVPASAPPISPAAPRTSEASPTIMPHSAAAPHHSPLAPDASADLRMPHGPCCSRVGPIGGAATAKPVLRRIEILVLGHLPGLGGTWAAQQARAAAQVANAPVCLVRHATDQLVVDLIWPDDARPPSFPACPNAEQALRIAAQHASSWLLRVQGSEDVVLDAWLAHSPTEPAADPATNSAADRVRLLTGADDPAIVAAYRRLKAWHAASAHAFARLARVTIVEPDAARAHAAETRLRKAAASFLEAELAPAERLGAMRPVRVTTLYCGPFDATAPQTLALLRAISREVPLAAVSSPETADTSHALSGHAPTSHAPASRAASHADAQDASVESEVRPSHVAGPHARGDAIASHAHEPVTIASSNGITDAPRHSVPPASPAHMAATNGAALNGAHAPIAHGSHAHANSTHAGLGTAHHSTTPSASRAPAADQLIAMIARSAGIDTLRAAHATCPWAPSIVLAVDHQGEFHAIAFAPDEPRVAHATVDLLTASRWCTEHASLLAMASITPRAMDATLHLITTAPAAARRLADTGLRVHAAVCVGDNWGAVALS